MADLSQYSDEELARIAGVTLPGSKPQDLSGMSDEDLMAIARPKLQAPDGGNLFQRIGQDVSKRNAQANIYQNREASGQTNPLQEILPLAGQGFGLMGDIGGEVMKSGYRSLKDLAPQTIGGLENAAGSALSSLSNTDIGQAAIGAGQQGLKAYGQFAEQHPVLSSNIEGGLNTLAGALPIDGVPAALAIPALGAKIASAGTKVAAKTVGKVGQGAINNLVAKPAINSLMSGVDDETKALAKKAADMGIRLRVDQVADSDPLSMFQKVSQEVPYSGVRQFEKAQNTDINSAIGKAVGVDTKTWNPQKLDTAFKDIGQEFNKFFSGKNFVFDQSRMDSIGKIAEEAERLSGSDTHKIVRNIVNDFVKEVGPNGEIAGEKLNELRSSLGEFLRSNKDQAGEAAEKYVQQLLDNVLDVVTSGDPDAKDIFTNLKYRYKNLLTITPLVAKSTRGNLNGQLLEGAVKRIWGEDAYARGKAGELGDIAKISKTFLVKQRGSDTLPKAGWAGGILGAGGALLNPGVAGAAIAPTGLGVITNRVYQNAISNPGVVKSFLGK